MIQFWKEIPMTLKIIFGIAFIGCLCILASCSFGWLKNYPQDNFVEEMVEDVIKHETGLDIDITPFSSEIND